MKWLWVLEDDLELCSLVGYFFELRGYQAVELNTLNEAWLQLFFFKQIDARKPECVISDFEIGSKTSEEWLLAVRQALPDIDIICLTACQEPGLEERLRRSRIRFLAKPTRLSEILKLLD